MISEGIAYIVTRGTELLSVDVRHGNVLWRSRLRGCSSQPVIADGVVGVCDGNQRLLVVDAKTGQALWDLGVGRAIDCLSILGGVAYAALLDDSLHAFDARSGKRLWTTAQGIGTNLVVAGGALYGLARANPQRSRFRALDATSGRLLWELEGSEAIHPVVVSLGVVFTVSADNHLRAFDAKKGELLWDALVEDGAGEAVVADGMVYVGSSSRLYAYEAASGKLLWTYGGHGGRIDTPVVANGLAIAVVQDSRLLALDGKTGDPLWDIETLGVWGKPAIVDGVAYVAASDGHLRALDARAGRLLWDFEGEAQEGQESSPAIGIPTVVQGTVVCGSVCPDLRTGRIRAIDAESLRDRGSPLMTWCSERQFWWFAVWGKSGLGIRKAHDGFALSQILDYDHWESKDALAKEIDRLATLGDWDAPKALADDPATLCPPELKVDAKLTKQGIRPAAQFYVQVGKKNTSVTEALEYAQEAVRLAPEWDQATKMLAELQAMQKVRVREQ